MKPDDGVRRRDMRQTQKTRKTRKTRKSIAAALGLAILAILALLSRCLGLGIGTGSLDNNSERHPDATIASAPGGDARSLPGGDAGKSSDMASAACMLRLSSTGLTLAGAPATVDDAVRACRQSGKANLRVTGAATVGSYQELTRALEEAGVRVSVERGTSQL